MKSFQKNRIPTHLCLINYLNDKDLEGLRSALKILKDHYNNEEKSLSEFINRPIETLRYKDSPILAQFIHTISNLPPQDKNRFASFASEAIPLLVQHGVSIEEKHNLHRDNIENEDRYRASIKGNPRGLGREPLLFDVMLYVDESRYYDDKEDLLNQTIFKALINAGADLTIINNFAYSLLHHALNLVINTNFNCCFYARYLMVECGVQMEMADRDTEKNIRSSKKVEELYFTLVQERREKENEYSQKKTLISQSLFSRNLKFPESLVQLTLEYYKNYSPAFLRSVEKTKLKPTVENNKPKSQNLTT